MTWATPSKTSSIGSKRSVTGTLNCKANGRLSTFIKPTTGISR